MLMVTRLSSSSPVALKTPEDAEKPAPPESVKSISGTLKTQLDYKTLRDEMIEERLQEYENIR